MIWAIGAALIVLGTLVIIFAMQDKWPIAPHVHVAPPADTVNNPSSTSGKPAERVTR